MTTQSFKTRTTAEARPGSDLAAVIAALAPRPHEDGSDHLAAVAAHLPAQTSGRRAAVYRHATWAGTYLRHFTPPAPWNTTGADGRTVRHSHPDGRHIVDVLHTGKPTSALVDEATRQLVRHLIEHTDQLAAVRIVALCAPTRSLHIEPNLPVRHQLLVDTAWRFGLEPAQLPSR